MWLCNICSYKFIEEGYINPMVYWGSSFISKKKDECESCGDKKYIYFYSIKKKLELEK